MTNVRLNPRQRRFVNEYLLDLNATQAFIRAGYSAVRAHVGSSKLLAKGSIQMALQESMAKRQERLLIKQDDVLLKLKMLLEANLADYVSWDADNLALVPSNLLSRQQTYCIQELSIDKDGRIKIKLHDKIRAAQAIMEHSRPESELDRSKNINIEINIIERGSLADEHTS